MPDVWTCYNVTHSTTVFLIIENGGSVNRINILGVLEELLVKLWVAVILENSCHGYHRTNLNSTTVFLILENVELVTKIKILCGLKPELWVK